MNPVSSDDEHCHQQANNLKYIIVYINRPMNENVRNDVSIKNWIRFFARDPK